jgi:hypothetical protein
VILVSSIGLQFAVSGLPYYDRKSPDTREVCNVLNLSISIKRRQNLGQEIMGKNIYELLVATAFLRLCEVLCISHIVTIGGHLGAICHTHTPVTTVGIHESASHDAFPLTSLG